MKLLFKILISLTIPFLLNAQINCNATCQSIIDTDTNQPTNDLNCTLPNIQTLTINAINVLDKEGNLTTYWNGKTVCDVLGWMNNAVDHIDPNYTGLKTNFTQTMELKVKPLDKNIGGATGKTGITFDSERPYLFSDDGTSNFHWLRMKFIVVHEFSHFIEKNSQAKTHSGIPKWVEEGRAKDFEDIVYDSQNPYSDISTSYFMYEKRIANVLNDGGLTKYDYPNFIFFKALRNKCGHIEMGLLTNDKPNLPLATNGCVDIPTVGEDDLAGLFTLYNWAMLYKQDLSLLDGNEPKRPNDKIFDGKYEKIDEEGFNNAIDIKSKIGTFIAPFSAKSFFITHKTLLNDEDMNLTFKSTSNLKLIAIRVKEDGSSSNIKNNFTMSGKNEVYVLTEPDKAAGLFVTLLNTTDKEIGILDINLTYKTRFSRDDTTNIVTDHERGLMWQDETNTWLDSWYGAKRHCDDLTLGDYDDWRVPTYDELIHILDLDGEDTYRYEIFEHLGPVGYWSLELNGGVFPNTQSAKVVNFGLATWIWINTSAQMNTRCTRTKE